VALPQQSVVPMVIGPQALRTLFASLQMSLDAIQPNKVVHKIRRKARKVHFAKQQSSHCAGMRLPYGSAPPRPSPHHPCRRPPAARSKLQHTSSGLAGAPGPGKLQACLCSAGIAPPGVLGGKPAAGNFSELQSERVSLLLHKPSSRQFGEVDSSQKDRSICPVGSLGKLS